MSAATSTPRIPDLLRPVLPMMIGVAHDAAPLLGHLAQTARRARAAGLLTLGRGIYRAAEVVERGLPGARMRVARAAMTFAEMTAPVSLRGTSEFIETGEQSATLLVVGTSVAECAGTVLHAAEKVAVIYARPTEPSWVSAIFPDGIDDDEEMQS